ncbi:MAG TPA: hypothetical protein VFS08_15585 [Gemmatimonadaceae bacterium]|nr:hypothetical protein [Gemmatimonadaceae bacterium]
MKPAAGSGVRREGHHGRVDHQGATLPAMHPPPFLPSRHVTGRPGGAAPRSEPAGTAAPVGDEPQRDAAAEAPPTDAPGGVPTRRVEPEEPTFVEPRGLPAEREAPPTAEALPTERGWESAPQQAEIRDGAVEELLEPAMERPVPPPQAVEGPAAQPDVQPALQPEAQPVGQRMDEATERQGGPAVVPAAHADSTATTDRLQDEAATLLRALADRVEARALVVPSIPHGGSEAALLTAVLAALLNAEAAAGTERVLSRAGAR